MHSQPGASSRQKTSDSKHLQSKHPELGQFKVVKENNGYFVRCTFPYVYHFSKFSKICGAVPFVGQPLNLSNLSLCPFIWNSHFYLQNFFYFWRQYLKQKFSKYKNFFLHLLKNVNNKHTLFELVSRWSVHQHPPRERLHSGRETWLGTMERTSASKQDAVITQKYKKRKNKKSSLSWEPEKATWAIESVPVDWKPERAVQAKIRGTKHTFPVEWKPERAV